MLSPQWALLTGIILSFPFSKKEKAVSLAKVWSTRVLQVSIILLGASLNFKEVLQEGAEGAVITLLSLLLVFLAGFVLSRFLNLDKIQSHLITAGTAVCGGSAMGALAPVLKADSAAIAISFAIVFLLNAAAVFIFPPLGNFLGLGQEQFGLWAAIAIHDTSSVVAAAAAYGAEALKTATTVKLTRALWIIPMTLLYSFASSAKERKAPVPWFIFGFLLVSLVFTFSEAPETVKNILSQISKVGFTITLFLIGLTFNLQKMKQASWKPFVFGVSLWLLVSGGSLLYIFRVH